MECWVDDGHDLIDDIGPGKKQEGFQYVIVANKWEWAFQAVLPLWHDTHDLF